MQKRMLFAGFTAVKKTIIQNWFTPHMCRKTYWIRSLLQIVNVQRRESWGQAFDHLAVFSFWYTWLYKGVTCFVFLLSFPLSLPFDLTWAIEYMSVVLFCYILDVMLCYVMCDKKKKNVDKKNKKKPLYERLVCFFRSLNLRSFYNQRLCNVVGSWKTHWLILWV